MMLRGTPVSNFQSVTNEFLESLDLDLALEEDLDSELVLEINESFSLVFGFDQVQEACVLRVLFNDEPQDARVLTELLQNSNTLDVAGYNLSFGIDTGQATAYGEVRIPDEDVEIDHLKETFTVFLQISEWYAEVKAGASIELPNEQMTQMWI